MLWSLQDGILKCVATAQYVYTSPWLHMSAALQPATPATVTFRLCDDARPDIGVASVIYCYLLFVWQWGIFRGFRVVFLKRAPKLWLPSSQHNESRLENSIQSVTAQRSNWRLRKED